MRTLLALVLLTAPALADDAHQMHTDDCARARKLNKTCVLDMGKETVESDRPTHDDIKIDVLKFTKADSLIRLRKDFIVEIIKTAEDL